MGDAKAAIIKRIYIHISFSNVVPENVVHEAITVREITLAILKMVLMILLGHLLLILTGTIILVSSWVVEPLLLALILKIT